MEKNFCVNIVHSSVMGGFAALACVALAGTVTPSIVAQAKLDTAKIKQLTGAKGELNEKEGVFTVRVPRTDLQVTTAGVKMNPAMGLTLYAAFMKAGAEASFSSSPIPPVGKVFAKVKETSVFRRFATRPR
jgi:Domain of Unknown Function (DUF1259)